MPGKSSHHRNFQSLRVRLFGRRPFQPKVAAGVLEPGTPLSDDPYAFIGEAPTPIGAVGIQRVSLDDWPVGTTPFTITLTLSTFSGSRQEIIQRYGEGFWFVIKAHSSAHIAICAGGCNAEDGPKDKQDVELFFAEA
jgi:hypothetical protein